MAITYVGGVANGRAGATGTYSQTITSLTGGSGSAPATGDLVVIKVAAASASGYAPTTLDISGWTNGTFRANTGVANYSYQQYSYKFMGSTPDTSITIPSSGNARNAQRWEVHVFRGVDPTTPLDGVSVVYASGTASGRPNPGPITPATSGAWILWMGSSAAAAGTAFTAPTDFATNWRGGTTADTYDSMSGFGYYTGWTSGQYDPAAITAGGTTGATDSWVAETLVLRPNSLNVYSYTGVGGATASGAAVTAYQGLNAQVISTQTVTWAAGANPAAQNISIPTDCTAVYVFWQWWETGITATTNGVVSMTLASAAADQSVAELDHIGTPYSMCIGVSAWYDPPTGTQSLDVEWNLAPAEGPACLVVYVKNGDRSSWRTADADSEIGTTAVSYASFATAAGDLLLKYDARFSTSETPAGLTSGWTNVATGGNNDQCFRLSSRLATGSTQAISNEATVDWSGLAAISIPYSAGGSTSYPYTGSGGAVTGSAATTTWHRQFAYTGSGGAATSGAANSAWHRQFTYTGSDGAVTGGAATTSYEAGIGPYSQKYWNLNYWGFRYWGGQYWSLYANTSNAYSWIGVGGAATGGVADTKKGKLYIGVGGAVTAGLAVTTKGKSLTASGGVVSGGAATTSWHRQFAFTASGGAVTGSAATTTWHRQFTFVASGGAVYGGASLLTKRRSWVGSGGAIADGTALVKKSRSWVGSGGAVSGGAAITTNQALNTYAWTGVGGTTASGSAIVTKGKIFVPSGGAISGGAALSSWHRQYAYVGSGGAQASGAATLARTVAWAYTSVGGAVSGGSALTSSGGLQQYVGSGGATTGGSADTAYSVAYSYEASGGAVTDGAADTLYHSSVYEFTPDGGAELAGEAVCFYISGQDLRLSNNSGIRRFAYSFTVPFAS